MMGSDYPQKFGGIAEAIETIHRLDLSDSDKAKIMGRTARDLLKLA